MVSVVALHADSGDCEQAAAWVDAVWGDREGHFHFAFGVGGHFNSGGKYGFERWHERSGRWPDDRERFLEEATARAALDDVYVAPYLRSSPSRKKGNALPSRWLYADVDVLCDGVKSPSGIALIGPGGLLVDSGRGRHPYLRLPAELGPEELERLNRHLARALEADAGWAENKVLRLPGAWNHKGRALEGGTSYPVTFCPFIPAVKDWTAEELVALLGPPPADVGANGGPTAIEPQTPQSVPAHLLVRLEEELADRSAQSFAFVVACLEAGLSEAETLALALEHRPTKDKYGERSRAEIRRSICKVGPSRAALGPHLTQPYRVSESESPPPWQFGSDSDPESVTVPGRPFALPASEFVALERPRAEALFADVDGRAVVGRHSLTLLGALGGHGKTTWFIDLALHLAAGVDYPPFTVPRAVSILMIENEGPEELFAEKLAARLENFPHELEARLDVCTVEWGGFSLADEGLRSRLAQEIVEKEYDLVFGDPLDSMGIEGVGSPEDTRKFLDLMKQTGLHRSVAWWLNTHPRKEETKEALNEISGAWGGRPDAVLLLRMLDDDRTQIRFPKLRWAKRGKRPTILLGFDPDTEAFTYLGEQVEEERDYKAEIRDLLAGTTKWLTAREIASPKKDGGIGANLDTVKKILDAHPDVFESRTGEAAKEVDRSAQATVWQVHKEDDEQT